MSVKEYVLVARERYNILIKHEESGTRDTADKNVMTDESLSDSVHPVPMQTDNLIDEIAITPTPGTVGNKEKIEARVPTVNHTIQAESPPSVTPSIGKRSKKKKKIKPVNADEARAWLVYK